MLANVQGVPRLRLNDFSPNGNIMENGIFRKLFRTKERLKMHSSRLYAPLRGIFGSDSVNIARCAASVWAGSPTAWSQQLAESHFQGHSGAEKYWRALEIFGIALGFIKEQKENRHTAAVNLNARLSKGEYMKFGTNMLIQSLKRFDEHPFAVEMKDREIVVGEGNPLFRVRIKRDIPLEALAASTSLALGEAFMSGDLEVEGDLYFALDHFLGQMGKFSLDEKALGRLIFTSTNKRNQQKEVRSHYDLGNDFYRLWLDETMSYSCGYFRSEEDSLYQAQVNKVDYILKKLYLKEEMELLDIGCGWGFLLIEAAKKYGVRGTGITLSVEQHREFNRRIREEGLGELLRAELMDYRDLPKLGKQFDRVVSVGMLEHVGRGNYPLFLECMDKVLCQGGMVLLHFISGLKEYPGDPWIKKYIFPGGTVPSLREILACAAEKDFHTLDVENLRLHYTRTLRCWERNFVEHREEVRQKFGDTFVRMWHLYLAACAATFHNGVIDLHQILFTKGINNKIPMLRWY